jgi:amino acid permease
MCLPYVFLLGGWLMGVAMLLFSAVLAYYSMKILFMSSTKTGIYSYGALLSFATAPVAGPLLDIVIVLYGSGVVIAYFVFLGDFMPSLATGLRIDFLSNRTVCLIISGFAAIPFALPRKLSALQYVSPISTVALVMTAIVAIVRLPRMSAELTPEQAELDVALFGLPLLKCFTISAFAFIAHMNVVSVAGELIHPTLPRASKVAFRAAVVQLIFYLVIGISGYVSFGHTVHQNFVTNYPSDDGLIMMCRFLLTLTIFVAIPINTNPTANAFVHLLLTTGLAPGPSALVDMEAPLVNSSTPTATISLEVEPLRNTRIITAVVVLIQGMILAIYAPGVADVISILGGSFGTLIMLVCPAIIYYSVFRDEMKLAKSKLMVGLLLSASCISAVAVFATIMKWI